MTRTVIVGNGMAATRLVEELVSQGYDGELTVIGEERHPAYNRILLSAVLEGTHPMSELTLRPEDFYEKHGVKVITGMRVANIDREAQHVVMDDHRELPYDNLVLATGSIPTLPPIRGLVGMDGALHPKVHAFRSMADCLRLSGAVPGAKRAVVVGAGLLGLQVARALSIRGLQVELVEGTDHVLSHNVGYQAGVVLQRSLKTLGTEVYTGARAIRLTDDGLRLDNGFTLDTDLIVLTAGGRPSTALAKRAGLMVRRGVVVDSHLRTVLDENIYAIGDCAEHRSRTTGFVPPAWEQAGVLARGLTGQDAEYDGSRIVARLRATGLDVAVMGDPEHTEGETVELANPVKGSYRKIVVRDGVLEAAVLIGDLSRVGLLTQLYDRRTVLSPDEPGWLLLGDRPEGESTTALPDDAEVCACAGVTAGSIRACADLETVVSSTRATTGCGSCKSTVCALLDALAPAR
ncbi:MAG TPA: FAD-dependent oxidoreductase [Nocardioidaceae bacterium]|nr:FAD-dependent oxidoreductase [Nocardioidaceae bacterium]